TIQGNMGANFDEGAWIVTGYIIAAVIVIPLTPWLQQTFGRKQYYVAAIAGFTITSALCGISTSLDELVFFRILQGLCGGGLIATGQAILRDTFSAKELGKSQALVSLGAIVGPSIGPTLGGILTDAFSWNWIFYINILPGIFAAIAIATTLRNPQYGRRPARFDGLGLALLAAGLGSLQYVLDEGERNDWLSDQRILLLSIVAVMGLVTFALWEIYGTKNPIVDLRILKNRTVAAGTMLALTIGFSLFGGVILSPQFQQQLIGFTATLSGESILLRALAIALFTPITLIALNRFHVAPRVLLGIGFIVVAIANAMQARVTTTDSTFWTFGWPLVIGGAGFGMLFLPLSVAVLSSVQGADTQKATSLISLCQQLGGSVSTAMLVTLLDRRSALHQANLAGDMSLRNPAVQAALAHHEPLATIYQLLLQQSTAMAFADAFLFLAAITLLLTPLVVFLRTPKARALAH
ncbi:MAG TPA: DHA2 family efflux MFS transporter permease subunit, partial [Candidatus Baltobacteraceae bacterium]|nr:DHA2 family efflux MFS transporter permease subunit [Candidatus Baltobacteraceae bacterium]